jgi:general secretion pathway protein A
MAGSSGRVFIKKSALKEIHKRTRGNLRQVNILMDRCLYAAYLRETRDISRSIVLEAVRDLAADGLQSRRRKSTWALAAGLALCLLVGLLFIPLGRDGQITTLSEGQRSLSLKAGPAVEMGMANPHEVSVGASPRATPSGHPLAPVARFLAAYRLSPYESIFSEALASGDLQEVSEIIFIQTGYRLVRLSQVPGEIRSQYGILTIPPAQGRQQELLLFWKPGLIINDFNLSHEGNEITVLKKMLAACGLYSGMTNSAVDAELIKAISRFQEHWGLPVTGYPDEKTIFLLSHSKGIQPHAGKKEKISG